MKVNKKTRTLSLSSPKLEEDGGSKFYSRMYSAFILLPFVYLFWADKMPYRFFELWKTSGSIADWLQAGIPMFIWGCAVTIVLSLFKSNKLSSRYFEHSYAEMALAGTLKSMYAGFVEEVGARWVIFMWAIVAAWISNFLFFGFLGFGIPEWFFNHVAGPIANWTTLGHLEPWLLHHEAGWAVGAGILGANATFRDGHKYQGLLGILNSWFLGMYLFWLTFTFGLWAAILVHFVYDFLLMAILGPFIVHLKYGK